MNKRVNYASLSLADLAAAGWPYRIVAHAGKTVDVAFATPTGGEERRSVSIDRLGTAARARVGRFDMDHGKAQPRRVVHMRMR